jgi:hypothetical protein
MMATARDILTAGVNDTGGQFTAGINTIGHRKSKLH